MLQRKTITCLVALITSLLFPAFLSASISSFETTRLKSTAGAGVGSILMEESTILNPAPLAFFQASSLYYQKTTSEPQPIDDRPFSSADSKANAFIVTDAKGGTSGSISYINQVANEDEKRTISLSLASTVGKKSALGVSYRFVTETLANDFNQSKEKYRQAVFGVTHVINPNFSLGVVAVDPFGAKPEETRGLVGLQYVFEEFLSLMVDAGADYNEDLAETTSLRAATQIKIYEDFYLRFGGFSDKGLSEKGTGVGIGWIQPKLVLEVALKNTTVAENLEREIFGQKDKETSFSLAYRF